MLKLRNKAEETAVRLLSEIDARIYGTSTAVFSEREHLSELVLAAAELIRAANEVQVKPVPASYGSGGLVFKGNLTSLGHVEVPEVISPLAKLEDLLASMFSSKPENEIGSYWKQKQQEAMSKPPMTPGFVRVYHMKDGTQRTAEGRIFDSYGEAESMLWCFQPSGEEGTDDMLKVDHVTIEKRFYPVPFWRG